MKRIRLGVAICALLGLLALGLMPVRTWAEGTSVAASAPSNDAVELANSGLEKALGGNFQDGVAKIHAAAKLAPDNATIAQANEMLDGYLKSQVAWKAQQKAEFDVAAQRVRRSMLVQDYQPKLAEANIEKPLRDKVSEARQSFFNAPNADAVEDAAPESITKFKTQIAAAVEKQQAAVKEALGMLAGDTSEYATTFRTLTGRLEEKLKAYGDAWAAIPQEAKARRLAARKLKVLEEDLTEAVEDVQAMTIDQPWRSGLMQARLAKMIAPAKTDMGQFDWYTGLVKSIKGRGDEAIKGDRWYDVLNVYASLSELDPDDEGYRSQLKIARRHVRVLGLYGKKADANATATASQPEADEEPTRWRDIVEGIDADIVYNAISQIDEQYYSTVDYRKLIKGGLNSIKILAETPQASVSFPALSDEGKKKQFIEAIDREIANIEKQDRVDHVHLQMELNALLRESEKSVNIPVPVLCMEFSDGFLEETDRFSALIWPSEVDNFRKQIMGNFFGVGIQIGKDPNEPLRVVSPLADSPAFREGIKTGDLILAVDGKRTEPQTIDKLVKMIQGPKGTKVVLSVKSRGQDPRDVTLVRDEIQIKTVKGWRHENGGGGDNWEYRIDPSLKIAYIRIVQFTEQTPVDFDKALQQIHKQGIDTLILDLRFNPGGMLEASKKVVDEFLDKGRIVSTKGRQKVQKEFDATDGGEFVKGNLVVLVNDMSASAAEIVSGALHDWRRGTIVGVRTFGKGSVQNVIAIPKHNAYLKLTTAHYYLPSGRCLHREEGAKDWGVDPDVEVLLTPKETRHWLDIRQKTDLLRDFDPDDLTADLNEEYQADMQLKTAMLLARLMQLQEPKAPAETATK